MQSTRLENSPVCGAAQTAGGCWPQTCQNTTVVLFILMSERVMFETERTDGFVFNYGVFVQIAKCD